ncbi:MAG: SurA N-terminal domain-containing protein [Helicobacteraceae bacterium]|jgi:peptidyl-prolyl cis-trans isomerase D|nr:SurA N-terminal domain-containing protein [Helicobacteraceae bacterium]
MIATLQKHRTFLVVVLTATVIAFIGSSAVGGGSYSYGSGAGAIAVVGDEKVSYEQFAQAYRQMRDFYNGMLDQPLNAAMERDLQNNVRASLIQEALLIAYARDVGLRVSDEEISALIIRDPQFQNNGVFDKNLYVAYLKNNRQEIKSFEAQLERRLLINKLNAALALPVTQSEKEAFGATQFGTDRITYKIVVAPKRVNITKEEAQAYYDSNTLQFMGEPNYDISYIKIAWSDQNATEAEAQEYYEKNKSEFIDDQGEIPSYDAVKEAALLRAKAIKARREALIAKNAWRDGNATVTPVVVKGLEFRNNLFSIEVMQNFENQSSLKEIAGPIEIQGAYALAKIDERRGAQPLPFEKAYPAVEEEIKRQKIAEYLKVESEKQLESFKGETTGFITRADYDQIKGLSEIEAESFLEQVFGSKAPEGVVSLEQKAVIYRIVEQKLFDQNKLLENDLRLSAEISQLKTGYIQRSLLENLQKRYPITVYNKIDQGL